jgi:all-trans-retinol 13,14-reductase
MGGDKTKEATMKYDIVIIGSGLGGLVCGKVLSQLGQHVLVLERGSHVGGCLQNFSRDGLLRDTGFHYVGGLDEGGGLWRLFKPLGLMDLPWRRLDVDGFDKVTIGGRTFAFRQGFNEFAEALSQDFPQEREAIFKFTRELRNIEESQCDMLDPTKQLDVYATNVFGTSAYQHLTETFTDPLLVNVLSGPSMKLELCRDTLPWFTFAHVMSSFVRSSWRLAGGGEQVANKLVADIRSNGGEVLTHCEVVRLMGEGRQITAAECKNGMHFEGRTFISDLHPSVTCQLLDNNMLHGMYRQRMTRLPNTRGMFTLSLTLEPHALDYCNYNHYVYSTSDLWAPQSQDNSVKGIMISMPAPTEESDARQLDILTPMSWEECKAWENTTVGHRGKAYTYMKLRKALQCAELAETVMPGLNKKVEHFSSSTPLTWRDFVNTPQGSAYGVRKNCQQPLLTVLSSRTPLPNLFLTGQSLVLHGLQGVTMTALTTCNYILGKETVWEWLNR